MIAEAQFKFPFDLNHVAIESYQHLGTEIGYREVMRMRAKLQEKIAAIIDGDETDSPVYLFLPQLLKNGHEDAPLPAAMAAPKDDKSLADLLETFKEEKKKTSIHLVRDSGSEEAHGCEAIGDEELLLHANAFGHVTADEEAPFARPEASDTVLSLSDILDEEFVDVKVLRNVFLADGNPADLDVSLVDGYEQGANVRRDGSIRVAVQDERRIIPFRVTHPEDPEVSALARSFFVG